MLRNGNFEFQMNTDIAENTTIGAAVESLKLTNYTKSVKGLYSYLYLRGE